MAAESHSTGTIRVASYNIRKAVGLDWRRDPARTLRVIAALGADVVALQEADKRLGPRQAALDPELLESETDLRVVRVARSPVSLGWHGNAILVRKDLEVVRSGRVALPGIEPRGAVTALIRTATGEVNVVGVHLGLRRGCRRLQFARLIARLRGDAPRTVIMGDFNEWSPDRGIEALRPEFAVVKPGLSFHASRPVAFLDRFALGSELSLVAAGVEEGLDARIASDHLPVWAELRIGSGPGAVPIAEAACELRAPDAAPGTSFSTRR